MARDPREELQGLYQRIGQIQREMAATGRSIYGPVEHTPEIIKYAAQQFAQAGFGPARVARFQRAMTEVTQYGPMGFIQRDIARIQKAINDATQEGDKMRQRVDALVQKAAELPLEQARNTRKTLQNIAKQLGVEMKY